MQQLSGSSRIYRLQGTPFEMGLALGAALGQRLEQIIQAYLAQRLDQERLQRGALDWLQTLPPRFRQEFEGLAQGAGLPVQRLAEWAYVEECLQLGCSAFVVMLNARAWVGRNNDAFVPELWGYAIIRDFGGDDNVARIPTLSFCMQGDVFTPTGINRQRLWLHYNYLEVWDAPRPGRPVLPPYVWMTDALETCSTLAEVEAKLEACDRNGGMLLFAVDGKTNEFALYECLCGSHVRRPSTGDWAAGTNHYCTCVEPPEVAAESGDSLRRQARLEERLAALRCAPAVDTPGVLASILADDVVERRSGNLLTVASNVVCPSTGEIWHTFGGWPAASQGNWQTMDWPWG